MKFKINDSVTCIDNTNLKGFITDGAIYTVKSLLTKRGREIIEIMDDKQNRHYVVANRFKKYQTLCLPTPSSTQLSAFPNECKLAKPNCGDCRECLKNEHYDELTCAYD